MIQEWREGRRHLCIITSCPQGWNKENENRETLPLVGPRQNHSLHTLYSHMAWADSAQNNLWIPRIMLSFWLLFRFTLPSSYCRVRTMSSCGIPDKEMVAVSWFPLLTYLQWCKQPEEFQPPLLLQWQLLPQVEGHKWLWHQHLESPKKGQRKMHFRHTSFLHGLRDIFENWQTQMGWSHLLRIYASHLGGSHEKRRRRRKSHHFCSISQSLFCVEGSMFSCHPLTNDLCVRWHKNLLQGWNCSPHFCEPETANVWIEAIK